MDTLIGAVAAKYVPPLSDNQPELLSRILQCVQEHFCEHDFNVSRAADLLGLSVAYLSKYFKRQTRRESAELSQQPAHRLCQEADG